MPAVKICKTHGANAPTIASMKEAGDKKIQQLPVMRKRARAPSYGYDGAAKLNDKMRKEKQNAKAPCARNPAMCP